MRLYMDSITTVSLSRKVTELVRYEELIGRIMFRENFRSSSFVPARITSDDLEARNQLGNDSVFILFRACLFDCTPQM